MRPDNDHVAARFLTVRGKSFPAGRLFPAADLGIDERSFDSLLAGGALVEGKGRKPGKADDDRLDRFPRERLLQRAREIGLMGVEELSKSEIIKQIRRHTR